MDRPHAYATIGDLSLLERDYALAEEYLLKAIKESPTYFKEAFESLAKVREFRSKTGSERNARGNDTQFAGSTCPPGQDRVARDSGR